MKLVKLLIAPFLGVAMTVATIDSRVTGSPGCGEMGEDLGSGLAKAVLYWICSEAFKKSLRNVSPLSAGLNAFWRVEGRVPACVHEFLGSPYMFLLFEDLRNDYKNRPVRFLEMSQREKEALLGRQGPDAEAVLGDIAFVKGKNRSGEETAQFVVFVEGLARTPERVIAHPGLSLAGAPDGGSIGEQYEKEQKAGWNEGLSPADKTVYAAYHYLLNSLGVTTALVRFEERQSLAVAPRMLHDPLLSSIRNPIQGGFMKEIFPPSPGNFLMFSGPPGLQPVCFGSDGRIVKPVRAFYEWVFPSEQERIAAGLEPDASLVFPPGM